MSNNLIRNALVMALLPLLLFSCRQDKQSKSGSIDFKRTGNELVIRTVGEPDRLNPLLTVSNYATQINMHIFQYLLTVDPDNMEFIPQLATALPEVSELDDGGAAYTFTIHEAAVWDDGSPVTAYDYVFTLKAVYNPLVQAQAFRPYLALIDRIEIDEANPKTFTVYVEDKGLEDVEYIGNTIQILPRYHYDPEGLLSDIALEDLMDSEKAQRLADQNPKLQQFADRFNDTRYSRDPEYIEGSGPYRLVRWEPNQEIVLEKKEDHWTQALLQQYRGLAAYPESMTFQPIENEATVVAAIRSEEIDVVPELTPDNFKQLKQSEEVSARYNFFTPSRLTYAYIAVNTTLPKLSDKRVRQALAHCIDVGEIIDVFYKGYAQPIANPVPPNLEFYNDELDPYAFNIERARSLLAEAGWEDSNGNGTVDKMIDGQRTELEIDLSTSTRERSRNVALLIQDNASKAGISIQLDSKEARSLLEDFRSRDYELASVGRRMSNTWNPKQNWYTEGDNRTGFGTARSDSLIDAILTANDRQHRNELYKELQRIIYDQQAEILILAPQALVVIHKRFDASTWPIDPNFRPEFFRLKTPN